MKAGITLIECLIYIGGCAFVAIIIATLLVTMFGEHDGGVLGAINRFLACHAVVQSLVDDVRYLHCGQGVLLRAHRNVLAFTLKDKKISWEVHKGRIIRTVTVHEKKHTTVLLGNGADLFFDYDYEGGVVSSCRMTLSLPPVVLKRFLCLKSIVCK